MTKLADRLQERRVRLILYAAAAAVLAVFCVFPQPYMSRAKVVPGDSSAAGIFGLSGGGGQIQNLASVFGDRSTTEVTLQLARSEAVAHDVIKRLNLAGADRAYATERNAQVALQKHVDVHTLLGGIIEVETRAHDQQWSLDVTRAFVDALSDRVGNYVRSQVARKRRTVEERMNTAQERVAQAQAELQSFRTRNRLADPIAQLGEQLTVRAGLEGNLQAKLVELATLRATNGPENPRLRAVVGQVAAIRAQIASTTAPGSEQPSLNVGSISAISLTYAKLYRNFIFAQGVYDVYARVTEEVAVQEIVAQDRAQLLIVDTPHIDAERYFNTVAVALLALLVALALFIELYAPATGLFDLSRRKDAPPQEAH